jgi:hypothetical protein
VTEEDLPPETVLPQPCHVDGNYHDFRFLRQIHREPEVIDIFYCIRCLTPVETLAPGAEESPQVAVPGRRPMLLPTLGTNR